MNRELEKIETAELIKKYENLLNNNNIDLEKIQLVEEEMENRILCEKDYEWVSILAKNAGRKLNLINKEAEEKIIWENVDYSKMTDEMLIERYLRETENGKQLFNLEKEIKKRKLDKMNSEIQFKMKQTEKLDYFIEEKEFKMKKIADIAIIIIVVAFISYISFKEYYNAITLEKGKEIKTNNSTIKGKLNSENIVKNPLTQNSCNGYIINISGKRKITEVSMSRSKNRNTTLFFEKKLNTDFYISDIGRKYYINLSQIEKNVFSYDSMFKEIYINKIVNPKQIIDIDIEWKCIIKKRIFSYDDVPEYIKSRAKKYISNDRYSNIILSVYESQINREKDYYLIGEYDGLGNNKYLVNLKKDIIFTDKSSEELAENKRKRINNNITNILIVVAALMFFYIEIYLKKLFK